MRTLRTLDKYIDTSMAHAETAGSVGMIFDVQDASMFAKQANGRTPLLFDGAGNPITTMQGVGVAFRKPGSQPPTTIHLNQPGPQFEPTVRTLGHMASRALNGPYSQVSGNYSTETFASNRANRIDQRQRDVRHQHLGVWNPLMRPYCRLLIQYGLLSGRIKLPAALVAKLRTNPELLYRSNVPTPGEAYVNPAQESSAVATDLESGVGSQIEVIGRRGMSWKRVVRQQAKFEATRRAERRKLGLSDYPPVPGAMAGASGGGQDEGGDGEATDLNTGETPEDKRTREKSAGASVSGEDGGIFDGVGGGRFAHLNGHANGVHR
jgi:capsid protein